MKNHTHNWFPFGHVTTFSTGEDTIADSNNATVWVVFSCSCGGYILKSIEDLTHVDGE